MNELLKAAKQSLSIVETATLKDEEIKMLIRAGMEDLRRQGINTDINNELVKSSIIMFVKANFGNVDIKEKELAQSRYSLMCNNLGLSSDYKECDSDA
ncbi:hypothetical protein [Faecalibacillus faecis]|uniref:phage head-tail connector protein n=1 Tax=Faecalibacillus faecis TaxID=1982628 RepID=UPI002EBB23A1|nr:hypothetical protein [Clostridia bacterium]